MEMSQDCLLIAIKQFLLMVTKILTEKIDDLHKIAKALITYETLTGEEIENIINKNVYPKDKVVEKPEENDDQSSALGAMGLKPKIVH